VDSVRSHSHICMRDTLAKQDASERAPTVRVISLFSFTACPTAHWRPILRQLQKAPLRE
jgi:hypothetical protein